MIDKVGGNWGILFIATTAGMAALDGAMLALLIASGVGYGTYKLYKEIVYSASEKIYDLKRKQIWANVEEIQDKDCRSKMAREATKEVDVLRKRREESMLQPYQASDRMGINEAVKLVGLGAFAFPVLGVGIAVAAAVEHKASKSKKRK